MFKSIRSRYILNILVSGITLFTATACSTTKVVQKESDITIERIDSDNAIVSQAYLMQAGEELMLRGKIKRRHFGRGAIYGHLHVTLTDSKGKAIKTADIGYTRRSVKSSFATFSITLPDDLKSVSTIRITHFKSYTHNAYPKQGIWRDGE